MSSSAKSLDIWLEIICKTCLGVYGLLESATLLDVARVEGLVVWGAERSSEMNRQAQMLWFLALSASLMVSWLRLVQLFAHKPVPKDGGGFGTGEKPSVDADGDGITGGYPREASVGRKSHGQEVKAATENGAQGSEMLDQVPLLSKDEELRKERERLKAILQKRKAERRVWMRNLMSKANRLGWKLLADTLDIMLPANAVGWIQVDPGIVGIAMLVTSFVTGREVWRAVGEELRGRKQAQE